MGNYESGTTVASEASYPYKAVDGTCKTSYTTAIPQGGITGYKSVGGLFTGATVNDLKSALQSNPVSIAIEADQSAFQNTSPESCRLAAAPTSITVCSPPVTAPRVARSTGSSRTP